MEQKYLEHISNAEIKKRTKRLHTTAGNRSQIIYLVRTCNENMAKAVEAEKR